jgi:hypothetical protein
MGIHLVVRLIGMCLMGVHLIGISPAEHLALFFLALTKAPILKKLTTEETNRRYLADRIKCPDYVSNVELHRLHGNLWSKLRAFRWNFGGSLHIPSS